MLSQTAEYALRAVLALADRAGHSVVTSELAAVTGAPTRYLAKVLQVLARHGLVRSQRGVHGGFVLAGSSDSITVLQVVRAVEPTRRVDRRPLPLANRGLCLGALFRRLDETAAAVEATFARTTIADLLEDTEPTYRHELVPAHAARAWGVAAREVVPC